MNLRKYLIYVAGPVSRGDVTENVRKAHEVGLELLKKGFSVIVPHGSCFWGNCICELGELSSDKAFMAQTDILGAAYQDFLDCDLEIVRRCDAVLRLPGESPGADKEVAEANKHGVHVFYSVLETVKFFEWVESTKLGS